MKRAISLILAVFLLASVLGGCVIESDKAYVPTGNALVYEGMDPESVNPTLDQEEQELTLAYDADASMNPLRSNSYTNRVLFSLIYQGLFCVDPDYQVYPMLCEYYRSSPSGRTWTFYINSQATFSDGTALTIDDVLASLTAAKGNKYYSGRFTHVSSMEISEDGALVIVMDTPFEDLPLLLDIPIVKAEEVEADSPLGTGPYTLEQKLAGAQLRRNRSWWCNASLGASADAIPLIQAESPSQVRDEFEFSDVGLVCAAPYSSDYADFRGDFELWEMDSGVFLYLACNVNYSADGVFLEPGLRSVLTYAIDREYLVDTYYHGLAEATTLASSPSFPYYSEALASNYEYDPIRFIEEVSGYSVKKILRLLVNKDDIVRLRVAREIADMLTELGLPTETVEKDTNSFIATVKNGEYDLYLGQTKLSPNMDLTPFFGRWGELSYNGISNTDLNDLCLAALENHGNYYNLLKSVAEDGRIIPVLFANYAVYAERGLLSDLSPSRDNVFFYTRGWTMADAQLETLYTD